jgi:hypothetical protein
MGTLANRALHLDGAKAETHAVASPASRHRLIIPVLGGPIQNLGDELRRQLGQHRIRTAFGQRFGPKRFDDCFHIISRLDYRGCREERLIDQFGPYFDDIRNCLPSPVLKCLLMIWCFRTHAEDLGGERTSGSCDGDTGN